MTAPAHVLAAVRSIPHPSIPHPRQEPHMTTPHPSPAEQAVIDRFGIFEPEELRAFAEWVVSLDDDDPESPGRRERRTVTLNQIVGKARAALSPESVQS